MSAISILLARIKSAVYGEEVRGSIHDAIEQCYEDVTNAKTLADNSISNSTTALNNANDAVNRANAAQRTADNAIADVTAARDAAVQAKDDAVGAKNNVVTLAGQVNSDKTEVVGIKGELTTLGQSVHEYAQNASDSASAAADSAQEADDIRVAIEEMYEVHEAEISDRAKLAILDCFRHVAWADNKGTEYYNALSAALEPPAVDSIVADFKPGDKKFYTSDTVESLRKYLNVKVLYNNGKQAYTRAYSLSGTLLSTRNIITVTYSNKSTTFVATAIAKAVSSITCTYNQTIPIYEDSSLDLLRNDLIVVAYFNDSTEEVLDSLNYTLSGTLTEGTSVITVYYGGSTATFNVTVGAEFDMSSPLLHSWDLTSSLTDSVNGYVASTNASNGSDGVTFDAENQWLNFNRIYSRGRAYEIDVGSLGSVPVPKNAFYRRLFCFGENGNATSASTSGFLFSNNGVRTGWWWYLGSAWDSSAAGSSISSANSYSYFNNKTVRIYIDPTGKASIYAKGVSEERSKFTKVGESHGVINDYDPSKATVCIGGSSVDSMANATIKGLRVYSSNILYAWDLTKSLTDIVSGKVATTNGTRDSNGLSFKPVNKYIDFGTVYSRNRTYEIDIDHIGLPSSESKAYRRIFCFGENGTNTSAATAGLPVAMSDYRPGWWWYFGNQWDTAAMGDSVSTVDSYNFFDGKTMKIYIDSTGYAHVWAKLINQPASSYVKIGDSHGALNDYSKSNAHVYIGGDSDNLADTLVKAFRVYEGEV